MLALAARGVLRVFGWRVQASALPGRKGIIIVYPHTSNWDLALGLLARWALALPIRWIGKESLFRGVTGATVGRVLHFWGGRPVDRRHSHGAVAQLAQLMAAEEWCWLGLAPEGTRKYTTHIRSGFYYLALQLDLPVGLAYFDYRTHVIGVTDFVRMSGSVDRDLALLRAYYADKVGRHPQQQSDICFAPGAGGSQLSSY